MQPLLLLLRDEILSLHFYWHQPGNYYPPLLKFSHSLIFLQTPLFKSDLRTFFSECARLQTTQSRSDIYSSVSVKWTRRPSLRSKTFFFFRTASPPLLSLLFTTSSPVLFRFSALPPSGEIRRQQ